MQFSLKQLATFIRAYKAMYKPVPADKSHIEWLMLASSEIAKTNFPHEEVISITITDKARKCLEK